MPLSCWNRQITLLANIASQVPQGWKVTVLQLLHPQVEVIWQASKSKSISKPASSAKASHATLPCVSTSSSISSSQAGTLSSFRMVSPCRQHGSLKKVHAHCLDQKRTGKAVASSASFSIHCFSSSFKFWSPTCPDRLQILACMQAATMSITSSMGWTNFAFSSSSSASSSFQGSWSHILR